MHRLISIGIYMIMLGSTWFMTSCCEHNTLATGEQGPPLVFYAESLWPKPDMTDTRSGNETPYSGDNFGVFAYLLRSGESAEAATTAFMSNQLVTRDSETGEWIYDPVVYWPFGRDEKLLFYAYAPYSAITDREDIVVLEDNVVFEIDGTQDILWADKIKDSEGTVYADHALTKELGKDGVGFGFKHILQKLSFQFIQGEDFEAEYFVHSLMISDLKSTLMLDVKDGSFSYLEDQSSAFVLADADGDGKSDSPYPIKNAGDADITVNDVMYIDPSTSLLKISMDVGEENAEDTYKYVQNIPLQSHGPGNSYLIVLKFTESLVDFSVKIVDWDTYTYTEPNPIE